MPEGAVKLKKQETAGTQRGSHPGSQSRDRCPERRDPGAGGRGRHPSPGRPVRLSQWLTMDRGLLSRPAL